MSRIPVLKRDQMDTEQQSVHDAILTSSGRAGKWPPIAFGYSPGLSTSPPPARGDPATCSQLPGPLRVVSLMTVRHWNAAYPWSAQAASAARAGLDRPVIEAINAGAQPEFTDSADQTVHAVARELLETGTLGADGFKAAASAIGYRRMADVVGVIGHFSATAMMANVAGAEPPADAAARHKA